ncbi:MAG: GNAT family N-acetyltransferase [Actinomycetia bacterium]|nr:GNAT family N-acetyltransferase [Actinomycetes bacterium]
MSRFSVIQKGSDRMRVGPWHGDDSVAYVVPLPGQNRFERESIKSCRDDLTRQGYTHAVTAALGPGESQPFLAAGFTPREELRLLRHDLSDIPDITSHNQRRGLLTDIPAVLEIDHSAFQPFWRLDQAGIKEARRATPVSRFRIATAERGFNRRPSGYAITGRADRRGYLQRLAVDPRAHGHGLGAALVVDSLRWLKRHHATDVTVNTQASNEHAYALYQRLGFEPLAHGLMVLECPLEP